MPPAPPSRMPRRAHRRRLVALVAVGALASIAATCQAAKPPAPPPPPPPPSVYCHNTTPTSAAQYQAAFDGLRATNTAGWVANDGGLPVKLPDGRVLWMFGDTIIGAPPNGPVNVLGIANNGFVVQNGNCFTPMTEPIPDPPGGHWVWPTGAVVDGNRLRVLGFHMRKNPQFPPPFDFELVSIDVTTFSLPGLVRQSGPTDLPLPSDPTYGESLLVTDEFVYAYGHKQIDDKAEHYVARTPVNPVLDLNVWEFWSDGSWVLNDPGATRPMLFERDGDATPTELEGPLAAFGVARNGARYLGSAFRVEAFFGDKFVETWDAAAPQGPWMLVNPPAADITSTQGALGPGQIAYGARLVLDLPNGPLALWSTHNLSFDAVKQNPKLYKVWFAPPASGSIP